MVSCKSALSVVWTSKAKNVYNKFIVLGEPCYVSSISIFKNMCFSSYKSLSGIIFLWCSREIYKHVETTCASELNCWMHDMEAPLFLTLGEFTLFLSLIYFQCCKGKTIGFGAHAVLLLSDFCSVE